MANQGALDLNREVERFRWKVDAGAEYVMTQPVFDPERLDDFLERTAQVRIPVIAGLWPLSSLRNAEFLANEVPGVHVPDSVIRRMRLAQEGGSEAAAAEGIEIALEVFERIRGCVQGVHIGVAGGRTDRSLTVLRAIGA